MRRITRSAGGPTLFVYGTLRRGASRHGLLAGAVGLGEAIWQGRLYRIADYPGAVASPDPADAVRGEVYRLPETSAGKMLERLDRYEGPSYRRERSRVTLAGGEAHETWVYVYTAPLDGLSRIASGDFLES